ncbi:MAG: DsbA family protein [Planctomycetota bacterium]|jgi:protein-disulfide isomerase
MQTSDETTPSLPARLFWPGLGFLLLAIASSVVLAGAHLEVLTAPGCGEDSPCAQAAASPWGKVPLVRWPVSFLGLAWFAALMPAWIAVRGSGVVPRSFRNLVRLGAAFSAMFMVVMIAGRYACPYCIAAHAGNFAFLAVIEISPVVTTGARRALAWLAAAFVAVTGVQIGLLAVVKGEVEQQLAESTQQIIEASQDPDREPFTGRYRMGPADASIRLVIFTDYQCPDCKIIEQQVRAILAKRPDVSFSSKHNPICTACNPYTNRNMHPNACWAARAAETAGILRGDDGFWQMHHWLFNRGGSFTDSEITTGLQQLGYDAREFLRVMQGADTLRRVKADIEEAKGLGIHRTPMIFINGVELKGWLAPNSLIRAVDELAASNPPSGNAAQDSPPSAFERYLADWVEQPQRALPADTRAWTMGPDQAAVRVVLWGDYQEPYSSEADAILRRLAVSRGDTRYTFRHYPMDRKCNPVTPKNLHPLACYAARAAEAAGAIDGNDGYWAMHEWLFENPDRVSEEALREMAIELGIDEGSLFAEMDAPEVAEAIVEDAQAGKDADLRGIPFIFINEKRVPRWNLDGVLEAIVEEAAGDQASTKQ